MQQQPILIQGAMPVEVAALREALEGREDQTLHGFSFSTGTVEGHPLVVSETQIGTLNAALSTAVGIGAYAPRAVINQGLAGAHVEELAVGDLVVGTATVALHGMQSPARAAGEGCAPFDWVFDPRSVPIPSDEALLRHFAQVPWPHGRAVAGVLGSGDLFSREIDRIRWMQEKKGELCEEMESVGTYECCRRFGVPCIGVRVISNNELTGEPFTDLVAGDLQRWLLGQIACL
ncbi:5'-methylthioadenosine/S-adenosylhomocysteine nucleosidase [Bittarella massiliensis]|uniref:5'-methylthioadenosine/S-adenosylhomocysteine nucleosidase n=1 Tax=Bittarella massiliensis (ex Durand et al. 2017) TaxID=1720313 RepID=UPI00163CE31C|nr:5'-methylthioadenosine/S-adenosylhomocysteine nucleosidase [Bittarella massiliensis (ex Durand et al. 2017)]MBC2870111.1 5'-methylthioadenosine/S-adenosylhomocysteine nucleosidase [Bittarella massiliensis (ex Durand et al. 2017)]